MAFGEEDFGFFGFDQRQDGAGDLLFALEFFDRRRLAELGAGIVDLRQLELLDDPFVEHFALAVGAGNNDHVFAIEAERFDDALEFERIAGGVEVAPLDVLGIGGHVAVDQFVGRGINLRAELGIGRKHHDEFDVFIEPT